MKGGQDIPKDTTCSSCGVGVPSPGAFTVTMAVIDARKFGIEVKVLRESAIIIPAAQLTHRRRDQQQFRTVSAKDQRKA